MKQILRRNLLLVAAGAGVAVLISAASAQDPNAEQMPHQEKPAELDRTFGDDRENTQAGVGGAGPGEQMARDGGTGGAGEAGTVIEDDSVRLEGNETYRNRPEGTDLQRSAAGIETDPTTPAEAGLRGDDSDVRPDDRSRLTPGEAAPDARTPGMPRGTVPQGTMPPGGLPEEAPPPGALPRDSAQQERGDDAATGGTGEAGQEQGGMPQGAVIDTGTQGTDAEAGVNEPQASDVAERATRDDHTNIIMYGPNGLRPDEEVVGGPNGRATGGAGEAGRAPADQETDEVEGDQRGVRPTRPLQQ